MAAIAMTLSGCVTVEGPTIIDAPSTAAPGTSVTLALEGLYTTCCDAPTAPQPMIGVTVQLTDEDEHVLDEQMVDAADDGTASVTLDMPKASPTNVTVEIDGEDAAGIWVKVPG